MGDEYAAAVSKSVRHLRPIEINLSDNRLSAKGASEIIGNLSPYTKHLDLSKNKMGESGIKTITNFLESRAES